MNLSDHFTLSEGMKSSTALRLGIDNTPDDETIERMSLASMQILEPARYKFGIPFSPSSWFRCEELEKAICWGGQVNSPFGRWCHNRQLNVDEYSWSVYFKKKSHPKGEGIDFEIPGIPNLVVAKWCRDNIVFDQLILEYYRGDNPHAGWLHGSFSEGNNRNQVLTREGSGTFEGLPG